MTLKRLNNICFGWTSFLPIIWIMALYLFTISCTIELGHFPIPSMNDPKGIGWRIFYLIVWYGFFPMFYGSILWVLNLAFSIYYKTVLVKYLVIFGIGMSIVLVQVFIDPFNIIFWYLD